MAPSLNEARTTTRSIQTNPLDITDKSRASDYLDGMLKEFASTIRGVPRFRDLGGGSRNAGGSDWPIDLVPETTTERSRPAFVDSQDSRAGERTRLVGGGSLLGRTEWIEINSALEQLRREGRAKTGGQIDYDVSPLSYAQPDSPGRISETNTGAPVSTRARECPAIADVGHDAFEVVQSRSFPPDARSRDPADTGAGNSDHKRAC